MNGGLAKTARAHRGSGVPLFLTSTQARLGIDGTDWHGLGIGRDRFRRMVREGVIPSITDPDTGYRIYSRLALEAWAARNGEVA